MAAFLFAAVAAFFGHDVEHHLKAAGFTDPSSESERAERPARPSSSGSRPSPALVVLLRDPDDGPVDPEDPEVARLAEELRGAEYVGNVTTIPAEDGESVVLGAQLTSPTSRTTVASPTSRCASGSPRSSST